MMRTANFTSSLFFVLLLYKVSSNAITSFVVTTAAPASDGLGTLTVALYWNNTRYSCSWTPDAVGSLDPCNNGNWASSSVTPGTYVPYYFKVNFTTTGDVAVRIDTITITDDTNAVYTIDDFCIPSTMQCTFNTEMGATPGPFCDQYDYKNKYTEIAIGDKTNFELFYIDLRAGIENYPGSSQEGGIRPPLLTSLGFEIYATSTPAAGLTQTMSVQWDTAQYTCTMDASVNVECTPQTDPKICPGSQSRFFLSVLNPGKGTAEALHVEAAFVTDETGTSYYMRNMCLENSILTQVFYSGSPPCTTTGWESYKLVQDNTGDHYLLVGGFTTWNGYQTSMATAIVPQCIFQYPGNTAPPMEVLVLNTGNVDTTGLYGWDIGEYGYEQPKCPTSSAPTSTPSESPTTDPTNDPTSDPTIDPTIDPTSDPTIDPTSDPTIDPTIDPTADPTIDPTNDPTTDPTIDPTADPTSDPTIDPTIDPTSDPTGVPTKTPSKNPSIPPTRTPTRNPVVPNPTTSPSKSPSSDPTKSPSSYPSNAPTVDPGEEKLITATTIFWGILALAIFLFCCLFCFILIWWKRNKEDEEDESKAAPIAAAAVYATHKKEDTYDAYDIGQINTAPSMLDEEDHYGGQYEAVELQRVDEKEEEEIGKQYTIDGAAGTGGTGGNKGDDAVLNMLADGHDTGGKYKKEDTEINTQETFAEYNV